MCIRDRDEIKALKADNVVVKTNSKGERTLHQRDKDSYAALARQQAAACGDTVRREELERIAAICEHVRPATS